MYAKINSTNWTLDRSARSTLEGCDLEFTHEFGCPRQGSYEDCTCYVSRIRLVKTPVGDMLPTIEPDLAPLLAKCRRDAAYGWGLAVLSGLLHVIVLVATIAGR